MFTGQNSELWQCLSANACQLKKRFFENFTICRKALLNKRFGRFSDFGIRKYARSPIAIYWRTQAQKKAIRNAYCFQSLYGRLFISPYPYTLQVPALTGLKTRCGNLNGFSYGGMRDARRSVKFGTRPVKWRRAFGCRPYRPI